MSHPFSPFRPQKTPNLRMEHRNPLSRPQNSSLLRTDNPLVIPGRPSVIPGLTGNLPSTPTASGAQFTGVGNQSLCNTLIISKFQTAQRPTPSQSGRLGARHFTTRSLPITYKTQGSQPLPSFPVPSRHSRLDRESPEHTDRVRKKKGGHRPAFDNF